ncbi:MAG: heme-binding protein [Planctomycetaceae bacterium]|nr:MAG: heme-binding protein [Planctomycetaceae bacterium]
MNIPMIRLIALFAAGWFGALGATSSARAEEPTAQWIWLGGGENSRQVAFRQAFEVSGEVEEARLAATCDDGFTLYLNGERVLAGTTWQRLETADVAGKLKPGTNVFAVDANDTGGAAAFLLRLDIVDSAGKRTSIVSDASWKSKSLAGDGLPDGWKRPGWDDSKWADSKVLGAVGGGNLPWTGSVDASTLAVAVGRPPEPIDERARPAENVTVREGFRVEKLFDVPGQMGSWVSLTTDDRGRLIASDQGGAGLFLIEPADVADPEAITRVTKLPVPLSSAQGLLWAHDSLYVVVNGSQSGLHRAFDTDGDGLVDSSEYLMPLRGGGEHGPHAVILAPDGESLFVDAGNHTKVPEDLAGSRIPTNWDEDHVLPRRWDANGHAAGILAPGGWICRVDPQGGNREIFSIGYRNQYDIALNADGELFTYDADMEWDLGSPWYRPTRVNHATSGSEFGWRSGTGKWPDYYEDSLPAVVDIGPGSPVGITFGYGSRYPGKYQKALYLLDWTYSTIYACHLTPDGASYSGEIEDFVFGQPLQVTDAVIGHDGSLYFTVGGRGTKSALYRVVYDGEESTEPVDARDPRNQELRELRRRMEEFHRPGEADLDEIWGQLGQADRFIRYAARIALEHRPVDTWRMRAIAETQPRAALTALMALARQGSESDRAAVIEALGRIDPKRLDEQGRVTWLRNHQLALIRLGERSDAERATLVERLEPLFPGTEEAFNAELIQLLVRLESPAGLARGIEMMERLAAEAEPVPAWGEIAKRHAGYGGTVRAMMDNMPPVRSIHYAFTMRNQKEGWNEDLRRRYLSFFSQAAMHPGGASFPGFLRQMRDDAIANVPIGEQPLYDDILTVPLGGKPFEATPPQGPGQVWTTASAIESLGSEIRQANFDQGRNLYHATQCAKCHRFSGEGGAIGPDLSTAGRKFSLVDLMDSIIEPSKVISDQYGSHQILTSDGTTLVGRVVEVGDQFHVYTADINLPPQVIDADDIEQMVVSPISQMPAGTIDTLNPEELKHLIAYILSGGDRRAAYFK